MEPMSLPYATWCLQWLTNHIPHEILVITVFLMTLMIIMLIVILVVLLFLLLVWLYVHVFTRLMSAIPFIIKRIAQHFVCVSSRGVAPLVRDSINRVTQTANFKSLPPTKFSRPVSLPASSSEISTGTKSSPPKYGPPTHPYTPLTPGKFPYSVTVMDPHLSFIRFREQLYARVHIPSGITIHDMLPPDLWEPMPKNFGISATAKVPALPLPSRSPTNSASGSRQSTARD